MTDFCVAWDGTSICVARFEDIKNLNFEAAMQGKPAVGIIRSGYDEQQACEVAKAIRGMRPVDRPAPARAHLGGAA